MDKPFTDKLEASDVPKMEAESRDLLKRVLAIQAVCESGRPHRYVRTSLPTAPSKVDQLIVARTAAEEADHYRKVARLAGEVGLDLSYILSRPNQERYVNAFRGTITSWEEFAVFGFLIDRVGRYQLEEFIGCSFAPLDRILPDVIVEERAHIEYGQNKTAELAARGGASKEKIQRVVKAWYAKGLDMLGNRHCRLSESYRHCGRKRRANTKAR